MKLFPSAIKVFLVNQKALGESHFWLDKIIVWHHTSIAQLVQAVIITNVVLVPALLIVIGLRTRKTPADIPVRM